MPAFNESQLEVLKSLADTAFQGFSLDSLEGKRIASSLPTDAPDWQKAQRKSLFLLLSLATSN